MRENGDASERFVSAWLLWERVSIWGTRRRRLTFDDVKCGKVDGSSLPMAGIGMLSETHHEEIDQIKIKERKGSFSSRAPSGQCVESLRRYLVGV